MPLAVSIEQMQGEVRREIGFRGRVYPRWVARGKLRPEKAAEQLERMQALLEALDELRLARAFMAAFTEAAGDLPAVHPASVRWLNWCAYRGPLIHGQHAQPGVAPSDG